jgi:hypothetical protein
VRTLPKERGYGKLNMKAKTERNKSTVQLEEYILSLVACKKRRILMYYTYGWFLVDIWYDGELKFPQLDHKSASRKKVQRLMN